MKNKILTYTILLALTACQTPSTAQSSSKSLLDKAVALYQNGDYVQSKQVFIQADQAGHFKAKRYLGLLALNGQGENKNPDQAFAYFQAAAANGDITSQYWLGYCYENGIGTKADLNQAIEWYKKSAARSDHVSQPAMDALKRLGLN